MADAELEARRQALLDQRWARWKSMAFFVAATAAVFTGQLPLRELAEALRALAEGVP